MKLHPEHAIETLRAMLVGAPGVDAAEILIRVDKRLELESKQLSLEKFQTEEGVGVGVRLASGKKCAQSYCSQLDVDAFREMVSRCTAQLAHIPDDEALQLGEMTDDAEVEEASGDRVVDPTFAMTPTDEKINRLINLEGNMLKVDPRIQSTRGCGYLESNAREWLWTLGSKRVLHMEKTWAQLSAAAVAELGGSSEIGWDWLTETHYYDLDWSAVARNATSQALKLLGGKAVPSGSYSAILTARVMTDVLSVLSAAFSGDNVVRGNSFLSSERGNQVFSKILSISDDPRASKRVGSRLWDAEGTPTARLALVTEGRVEAFAHHKKSAHLMKTVSTGHALRGSVGSAPAVGFHNLSIEPGKKDFVDLLRDLGSGLVIRTISGVHTANPVTGEFSLGASGTWVERGEEQRPVTGVVISGNLRRLFNSVLSIGRDVRWDGRVGSPSILFEGLSVAGQ